VGTQSGRSCVTAPKNERDAPLFVFLDGLAEVAIRRRDAERMVVCSSERAAEILHADVGSLAATPRG
jgi:hypothetical protein